LPRIEKDVCFASSMVFCLDAQPGTPPDIITIRENSIQKIRNEDRLSTFDGIELEGHQVFLTSIILHLIWAE